MPKKELIALLMAGILAIFATSCAGSRRSIKEDDLRIRHFRSGDVSDGVYYCTDPETFKILLWMADEWEKASPHEIR